MWKFNQIVVKPPHFLDKKLRKFVKLFSRSIEHRSTDLILHAQLVVFSHLSSKLFKKCLSSGRLRKDDSGHSHHRPSPHLPCIEAISILVKHLENPYWLKWSVFIALFSYSRRASMECRVAHKVDLVFGNLPIHPPTLLLEAFTIMAGTTFIYWFQDNAWIPFSRFG